MIDTFSEAKEPPNSFDEKQIKYVRENWFIVLWKK